MSKKTRKKIPKKSSKKTSKKTSKKIVEEISGKDSRSPKGSSKKSPKKKPKLAAGRRCSDKTKAGKDCRGYAITGSKYCAAHDPSLIAERRAWQSAGGLARAVPEGDPVELLTVEDVRKGLAAALGSTWQQANTGERSRALGSLYGMSLKTFEIGELVERLDQVEAAIARLAKLDY